METSIIEKSDNSPPRNFSISPAQAAQEVLNRWGAKESFQKFIEYVRLCPIPAVHHRLLISELEAVERGHTQRLMILMPPGSAKSTYASILFPPWFMGRNPEASVLGVSNTTSLAERFSKRARNIVGSNDYRNIFEFGLNEDSASAGNWDNEKGGEYFCAGIGSTITGRRATLALIDDPIKSREEANSERIRESQWDWYTNDFLTRLKPDARQIVIQTRWHEDDLGGRILEREAARWRVIKLAMLAVPGDPLGRAFNDRLWPEWFTDEMVKTAQMDARAWNALYQQDPVPDTGDYFKRSDFNEYGLIPDGLHIYGASDYAVTDDGGDFTEHGIFGLDFNDGIYVLDWWRDQARSDVWIDKQCDLIAKYKPLIWFGESGVIRKAIEPFLKKRMQERRTPCRLEWLSSITDKVVRARAFQAKASMGDIFLPQSASWKADLMSQLMKFPAGKYDDGVDVCSLMGRGLEHIRTPEMTPEPAPRQSVSRREDGLGWMG